MKIVVTGGGGFVGKALLTALKKEGHELKSVARNLYSELEEIGINQVEADITDREVLFEIFRNADIVFHVAAKAGVSGPYSEFYGTNVLGTMNVIDACIHNGVGYLIYTSSASVVFDGKDIEGGNENLPYPKNELSAYTETKAIAEKAILAANSEKLKTMALRPHLIWGVGDRHILPGIIEKAKSGNLKIIGKGENKVDTTYIDNCTHAHICALSSMERKDAWGRAYFISDDSPVKLWDMLNKLLVASCCEPVKRRVSSTLALTAARMNIKAGARVMGKGKIRLTPFLVHELSSSHWFNISAAKEFLGYEPVVSIEEGIRKLAESFARDPACLEKMIGDSGDSGGSGDSGDSGDSGEQNIYSLAYLRKVNDLDGKGLNIKSLRYAWHYLKITSHLIKEGGRRLGKEASETKVMANVFFRMLEKKLDLKNRKEPPSEEEVKEAIEQLKDVGRFSLFATVSILPGGGFSLIGLELLARKFGIKGFTLVPSSFRKKK